MELDYFIMFMILIVLSFFVGYNSAKKKFKRQGKTQTINGNEDKQEKRNKEICMMCRGKKEDDGHTCCEECAGIAF